MTDQIEVRPGQIWKDWDKRVRDRDPGRRVRVESIEGGHAICTNVDTGKTTKIKLDRFRPTSKGYKFMSEAMPSIIHPEPEVQLAQTEVISLVERVHRRRVRKARRRVDRLERTVELRSRQGRGNAARKNEAKLYEARQYLETLISVS